MNRAYRIFLGLPLIALPTLGFWSAFVTGGRFLFASALVAWPASIVIAIVLWRRSRRWTRRASLAAIALYPIMLASAAWVIAVILGVAFPDGVLGQYQRDLAYSAISSFVPAAVYCAVFVVIAIGLESPRMQRAAQRVFASLPPRKRHHTNGTKKP